MTDAVARDRLTPSLAARFAATLDREPSESAAQGIHWCLCPPETPTGALGEDGHPPPPDLIPAGLTRRMWASGEISFLAPLRIGASVERTTRIDEAREKTGSSGRLFFLNLEHRWSADRAPAVVERQVLVYRAPPPSGDGEPAASPPPAIPDDAQWRWRRELTATVPLLFRYSALTFNSHRIHYDLAYARQVEGYPGLVVHGPLMASLLLDLADRELGRDRLASFRFRAVRPAFASDRLVLLGRPGDAGLEMRVRSATGHDHMIAQAALR